MHKLSLKDKILKENCSISEAATAFKMLTCEAEEVLFNKESKPKHISDAVKHYQKGHSVQYSSVASGVKPSILINALKRIRAKTTTNYRFKEEFSWIS